MVYIKLKLSELLSFIMFELTDFYKLTKKDIKRATEVYARAYSQTTLYKNALEGVTNKLQVLQTFFEVAIRYGIKYGFPYAPSDQLEGISIWLPFEKVDMTMWRMIRSGAMKSMFKLIRIGRKFFSALKELSQLDNDRRINMVGKEYLDLMSLAIDPKYQRRGIGGKLLNAMFEKTDSCGYSTYVSGDIDNVKFYKKQGFTVIKEVDIKIKNINIANYEMIRYPKPNTLDE